MKTQLEAQLRVKKEKMEKDLIAAVVYGSGSDNVLLKLNNNNFVKVYEEFGESNLIDLNVEGKENFKVLIKDIQRHPTKDKIIHVDFYKVNMTEKLVASIPLEFIGASKAVKELGAILMKGIDEISVECLPGDLIDHIDVDISSLDDFTSIIQIKDLKIPNTLTILDNLDDVVVTVIQPKEEKAELKEEPKVEEKKAEVKKEEASDKK